MVVTAIFVILSAVVLANNSRFGNLIVLQNLAHDMALSIREAQVYGIAVRRFGTGQFDIGYGVHFTSGNTYVLFADTNNDGVWGAGETVESTTIGGGYVISSLCAPATTCGLTRLDVLFRRPEPDGCISANGAPSLNVSKKCTSTITRGTITVQSPRGDQATIIVESSGQISVQSGP